MQLPRGPGAMQAENFSGKEIVNELSDEYTWNLEMMIFLQRECLQTRRNPCDVVRETVYPTHSSLNYTQH